MGARPRCDSTRVDKRMGEYMANGGKGAKTMKGENGEMEEDRKGLYRMAWGGGSVPVYAKVPD